MVYINCQCYDSMIIYLLGGRGHRDRAHVQLIEVPSGCIMVLSLTKRLYLIDVHFVPIASFAYKEQTAKDELACEEEYRKNNLCTNRMDSCA